MRVFDLLGIWFLFCLAWAGTAPNAVVIDDDNVAAVITQRSPSFKMKLPTQEELDAVASEIKAGTYVPMKPRN